MSVKFKLDATKNHIREILDLNVYFNEEILKTRIFGPGQEGLILYPKPVEKTENYRICKATWGLKHPNQPNLNITHIDKDRIEKSHNFSDLLINNRSVILCDQTFIYNNNQVKDLIRSDDKKLVAYAVLYNYNQSESKFSFAVLLDDKSPDSLVKKFPVIIEKEHLYKWLDIETSIEEITEILYKYAEMNTKIFIKPELSKSLR